MSIGMVALLLVVARLVWRRVAPLPDWSPALSTRERKLEHRLEQLLYLVMVVKPVSGYVLAMADGQGIDFFFAESRAGGARAMRLDQAAPRHRFRQSGRAACPTQHRPGHSDRIVRVPCASGRRTSRRNQLSTPPALSAAPLAREHQTRCARQVGDHHRARGGDARAGEGPPLVRACRAARRLPCASRQTHVRTEA